MKSDFDLIWDYLEGDLREEEMDFVVKRLNSDPAFRKLYGEQEEIFLSLQKTESIAFRKKLQLIRREMKRGRSSGRMIFLSYPWFIAAAVGLLCITTGYVLLRLSSAETKPPVVLSVGQKPDSKSSAYDTTLPVRIGMTRQRLNNSTGETAQIKEPDNSDLQATHYEINLLLEKLVRMHYRSAVVRDVLPVSGQNFTSGLPVWFVYHTETADSVCLSILDNKAGLVYDTCSAQGVFKWNTNGRKGLFYFQLSTAKETICTRKIVVR